MILFDQLRLSDDGRRLYINVRVNKADYFKDVSIEGIYVMGSDQVSETHPETFTHECLYSKTFDEGVREADLVLTARDLTRSWEEEPGKIAFKDADMGRTLFFVYVKCKGPVGECTPCRLDEPVTLGVTFDEKLLHQRVMGYTKALADDCSVPTGFTDFILLWNAFKASIETEHYIPAIKYWKMLFDNGMGDAWGVTHGCGCGKL